MTHRHIARWAAIAVLALSLSACATAPRPDPQPIADNADAETLAPEFHGARVGHDHLRGALPSE